MLKPEKFQNKSDEKVWVDACVSAQASISRFSRLRVSQDLNIRKTGWKLRNIYIKYCLLLILFLHKYITGNK